MTSRGTSLALEGTTVAIRVAGTMLIEVIDTGPIKIADDMMAMDGLEGMGAWEAADTMTTIRRSSSRAEA